MLKSHFLRERVYLACEVHVDEYHDEVTEV